MIEFYFPAPRIVESEILEFEQVIGTKLPVQYRQYLLSHAVGGTTIPDLAFRITKSGVLNKDDPDDEVMLGYLLSMDKTSPSNLFEYYDTRNSDEREYPYLPNDMITIGGDPGGGLLLIGIQGTKKGKVFYWDSNKFNKNETDSPDYNNISFVANSFSEFIDLLYELQD
jgi:hypothetical protein